MSFESSVDPSEEIVNHSVYVRGGSDPPSVLL